MATMPAIPVIMAGAFVFGCGLGPLAPNVFAMATQLPDYERARGIGLAKALMYGGPSIGILALEPIDRAFGTGAALTTVAAVSLAMGAYLMIDRAVLLGRIKHIDNQAIQAV